MIRRVLVYAVLLSSPLVAAAETGEATNYPLMRLECETVSAQTGSPFDAPTAMVIIPVPFHITNSDKRLKFYNSLIAFEGADEAYLLGQPEITQEDMDDKSGRYGDLRTRQSDDDIPTAFSLNSNIFELQTVTGFPVKESTEQNTFRIDTSGFIRVKLEQVTESDDRETPVWQGNCILKNVKTQS